MKKNLMLFCAIILGVITLNAQDYAKTYTFNNRYTGIKAGSSFDINLKYGDSPKVRIEAPKKYLDYISVYLEGGTLVFKTNFPRNFFNTKRNSRGIKVELYMTYLNKLDLSGAASLNANNNIYKSNDFELELSGASSLNNLNLQAQSLDLDMSGASQCKMTCNIGNLEGEISGATQVLFSGDVASMDLDISGAGDFKYSGESKNIDLESSGAASIILNGKTDGLKIEGSGACSISAKELIAKNVKVEMSGASKAIVYCTESLETECSPASSITYHGNPKSVINKTKNVRQGNK